MHKIWIKTAEAPHPNPQEPVLNCSIHTQTWASINAACALGAEKYELFYKALITWF